MFYETWPANLSARLLKMDEIQHRLAVILGQARSVGDRDFCHAFRRLVGQVEALFREQEDRMDESRAGYCRAHVEQHARLLHGLHSAHARIEDGDIALGRRIVNELLPDWFGLECDEGMPGRGSTCLTYS